MGWLEDRERQEGVGSKGPFLVVEEVGKFHKLGCPSCRLVFPYLKTQPRALCPNCGYKANVEESCTKK